MTEMKLISLKVPAELLEALKETAEIDSCSVSSVVRRACLRYIAEKKLRPTPSIRSIPIDDGE